MCQSGSWSIISHILWQSFSFTVSHNQLKIMLIFTFTVFCLYFRNHKVYCQLFTNATCCCSMACMWVTERDCWWMGDRWDACIWLLSGPTVYWSLLLLWMNLIDTEDIIKITYVSPSPTLPVTTLSHKKSQNILQNNFVGKICETWFSFSFGF